MATNPQGPCPVTLLETADTDSPMMVLYVS